MCAQNARQANRQPKQDGTAHAKRMAGRRQRRPGAKAAGGVWAGKQRRRRRTRLQQASRTAARAAAGNTRRDTACKSRRNSGWPRKNGHIMARRAGQKKPLRTGKMRIRSFACPEGPCEPGPPKNRFAVFGWHGLFLLRIAHNAARSAAQKGAPPPLIPCKLFEKSLTKNFTAFWPGKNLFLI